MTRKVVKKNTRRKYREHKLKLAIVSVQNGSSIREAADKNEVPYTTLNRHVNHEVTYKNIGRPTKFSTEEENHLKQAALVLQEWGVPLTINEFLKLSKEYASSLNKSNLFPEGKPTYEWFYSFLKRHSNLVLKKSYPLERKRAALTLQQIDDWFLLLHEVIQENDLENRPAQIFNCDESGLSDGISYSKVIVHRQTSNAYRVEGGTGGKSYTSVMFCASATGFILPPFVIYKSKRLFDEWCVGGPPDTAFDTSENGWMDQSLFRKWFEQVFLEQTKNLPRPLLLIIDGHGSHFDVEALKLAVQNSVIILCLPSNATHILQPLDIVFFNPLKIHWKNILKSEYTGTNFKNIGKDRFPSLLMKLWTVDTLAQKTNAVKSFMKAGIFPFNPNSIDRSRILKKIKSMDTVSSTSVLNTKNAQKHKNDMQNKNNGSNSTNSLTPIDSTDTTTNGLLSTHAASSPPFTISPFTTVRGAIKALDEITMNFTPNSSSENDSDEDDEVYVPPNSALRSSSSKPPTTVGSVSSRKASTAPPGQSVLSTKGVKRKTKFSSVMGFDTSDEEDNASIRSSSTEDEELIKEVGKVLPEKRHPSQTEQNRKRHKSAYTTVSFDVSDEDNELESLSSAKSQQSLTAITNAIQTVFAGSVGETSRKSTKRTVIDRSRGQVVTEKLVIEQLEERKARQTSKRSRPVTQRTSQSKRNKQGSPTAYSTTSTVTAQSSAAALP